MTVDVCRRQPCCDVHEVDGATWLTIDTNQTWVNGLMTVSEIMGIETNYTYDADGRVGPGQHLCL